MLTEGRDVIHTVSSIHALQIHCQSYREWKCCGTAALSLWCC